MTTRISSPEFIGRGEELQRLQAVLDGAAAGTVGTVLVGGEAGVGKTRLLEEFGAGAVAAGLRVVHGGCVDLGDGARPYDLRHAFASLLMEGRPVRLAGQDSRRGTFVQRFATIIDRKNADEWTPLSNLGEDQAKFYVYDSLLSEYAALGFEYGYSVARPDALVAEEEPRGEQHHKVRHRSGQCSERRPPQHDTRQHSPRTDAVSQGARGDLEDPIRQTEHRRHPSPANGIDVQLLLHAWPRHGNADAVEIGDGEQENQER